MVLRHANTQANAELDEKMPLLINWNSGLALVLANLFSTGVGSLKAGVCHKNGELLATQTSEQVIRSKLYLNGLGFKRFKSLPERCKGEYA